MKLYIQACLISVIVLALAVFGVIKRQSYTDISKNSVYLDNIQTAECPELYAKKGIDIMINSLPDSEIILRISIIGDIEHMFGFSQQKVCVQEVYKGKNLNKGDEIYITSKHWYLSLDDNPDSLERGYINIMRDEYEYLVFISNKINTFEKDYPSVYTLADNYFMAPVFCYEDIENVIIPPNNESTYVPYNKVKDNEFFATSEVVLDIWQKMKSNFLVAYPASK